MANLNKTKALFGFTSPRTLERIIPEIKLLTDNYGGDIWSGNNELQKNFYNLLTKQDFFEAVKMNKNPDFAARDRITRAPKSLGFVDLNPVINLTEAGKLLIETKRPEDVFTRQIVKFQLPSPYHTKSLSVDFAVRPYLELLRMISDLGTLSKTEIALFFSQMVNYSQYNEIIKQVLDFRKERELKKGSGKVFVSEYFEKIIIKIYSNQIKDNHIDLREQNDNNISLKKFIKTKKSNMLDYADAFSRYIRATQLVTLQKKTFRLIISEFKNEEVNFLLKNTDRNPIFLNDKDKFKKYLFNPYSVHLLDDNKDGVLEKLNNLGVSNVNIEDSIEVLKDKLDKKRDEVKGENIKKDKQKIRQEKNIDDVKDIFRKIKDKDIPDAPLFLEWNVWRGLVMLNYGDRIDGNFVIDIDGMPLNTAPGKKADIEAEYPSFNIIVEVTMSTGDKQYNMENEPVPRHYGDFKLAHGKETYCIFIAPKISEGTLAHYFNLNRMETRRYGGKTKIIPMSIEEYSKFIEIGLSSGFDNSEILKKHLENMWQMNQDTSIDEIGWYNYIGMSINNWVASSM